MLAYTDAVIEWNNKNKEVFGLQRLLQYLDKHRRESIHNIPTLLLKELQVFSDDQPCNDDLTALVVEFTGA